MMERRSSPCWGLACLLPLLVSTGASTQQAAPDAASVTQLTAVQSLYLERCGGCHGIQGHSAPSEVPDLRGQTGYFLCTQEGREYVIRLPSIATSPMSDQQLAELANFVVFDLGHGSEFSSKYAKYNAEEVHQLRAHPLNEVALTSYRARVVEALIHRCHAPETLRSYKNVVAQPSEDGRRTGNTKETGEMASPAVNLVKRVDSMMANSNKTSP